MVLTGTSDVGACRLWSREFLQEVTRPYADISLYSPPLVLVKIKYGYHTESGKCISIYVFRVQVTSVRMGAEQSIEDKPPGDLPVEDLVTRKRSLDVPLFQVKTVLLCFLFLFSYLLPLSANLCSKSHYIFRNTPASTPVLTIKSVLYNPCFVLMLVVCQSASALLATLKHGLLGKFSFVIIGS